LIGAPELISDEAALAAPNDGQERRFFEVGQLDVAGSRPAGPVSDLTFIAERGFARAQGCGLQVGGRRPVKLRARRLGSSRL